jgi:hypothetical protein
VSVAYREVCWALINLAGNKKSYGGVICASRAGVRAVVVVDRCVQFIS